MGAQAVSESGVITQCRREVAATIRELTQGMGQNVLVVGVGNPLRGDDVAGLVLGEKLAQRLNLEYLRCEEVPENYLTEMLETCADTILMVDAVGLGTQPGDIRILSPEELASDNISTHKCSVSLLASVLAKAGNKRVAVLGIQPESIGWGSYLSQSVSEAIDNFVASLAHEGGQSD